jgi:carboxymethylenebutenolidase
MCVEDGARPPLPPIRGSALDSSKIHLSSADGARVLAFAARAEAPSGAGIVILPDVRGLHRFYEELALRFAEAGVDAIAVDYFARTADTEHRDSEFDHQAHMAQVQGETLYHDVDAAAAHLRSPQGGAVRRLYTIGFCFGGRLSFLQASRSSLGLAGVIGFYGWPVGSNRGLPAPADVVGEFVCSVLAIFGEADQGIPGEARDTFEQALTRAGVEHRTVVYPRASHGFFDKALPEFAEQSADAWRQVLDFMKAANSEASAPSVRT